MSLYLGIDLGTTGCRTAVVDDNGKVLSSASQVMPMPEEIDGRPAQNPLEWWTAVRKCLSRQAAALHSLGREFGEISSLAVDGTSGTILLADSNLDPVTPGYMYNSAGFEREVAKIAESAPEGSIVRGNSSALARLLFLQACDGADRARHALHQADWVAGMLSDRIGISDENNVLKLGYDLCANTWPNWLPETGVRMKLLPQVVPAGARAGLVSGKIASEFGFSRETRVIAGTTDSVAAFIAAGARQVGESVTSLGTTLAVKLLSDRPVSDAVRGIYSHRIFGMWLAGGASNSGGGVLEKHFSRDQMTKLEALIDPEVETGLDYYPLVRSGERFPFANPSLPPRLAPRPKNDAVFFQGILEGIARIEKAGYDALAELGAPKVSTILTTGGGACNCKWTEIRRRIIGCKIASASADAAVGSALIAKAGTTN